MMRYAKIICMLVFTLLHNNHRKLVGTTETTSTNIDSSQNPNRIATQGSGERLAVLDTQVAGHGSSGEGLLRDIDAGHVLKGRFSEREKQFHETLETSDDPILKELRNFVPRLYGLKMKKEKDSDKEHEYLSMEDLTRGFTPPSVMDVKMGELIWEPGEREDKIARMKEKYVLMREHYGFSIPGIQYYDIHEDQFHKVGRPFTRDITPVQAIELIYEFFNGQTGLKSGLVNKVTDKLWKVYRWFKRQNRYKFYGSSILIVYDSASLKNGDPICRVRMIDFAHVVPNAEGVEETDDNYIRGLRNLIGLLENLEAAVRKYSNLASGRAAISDVTLVSNDGVHASLPYGYSRSNQILGRIKVNVAGAMLMKYNPDQEETDFYETLAKTTDSTLIQLKRFVPVYYGRDTVKVGDKDIPFMQIENILEVLEVPCHVELRIGSKRRPDWAPPEPEDSQHENKAMLERWKFTIAEYQRYRVPLNMSSPQPEKKSRQFMDHMQPQDGVEMLYDFVNGEWGLKCGLVKTLLQELQQIRIWFEGQTKYKFYNSSLLLTYDAKRLNDFSRGIISTEEELDENYLGGLRSLITILENILLRSVGMK